MVSRPPERGFREEVEQSKADQRRRADQDCDCDHHEAPDHLAEGIGVIEVRERLVRRRLDAEEIAKWPPAFFHLVHQKSLGRDALLDLFIPLNERLDRVLTVLELSV